MQRVRFLDFHFFLVKKRATTISKLFAPIVELLSYNYKRDYGATVAHPHAHFTAQRATSHAFAEPWRYRVFGGNLLLLTLGGFEWREVNN